MCTYMPSPTTPTPFFFFITLASLASPLARWALEAHFSPFAFLEGRTHASSVTGELLLVLKKKKKKRKVE